MRYQSGGGQRVHYRRNLIYSQLEVSITVVRFLSLSLSLAKTVHSPFRIANTVSVIAAEDE